MLLGLTVLRSDRSMKTGATGNQLVLREGESLSFKDVAVVRWPHSGGSKATLSSCVDREGSRRSWEGGECNSNTLCKIL